MITLKVFLNRMLNNRVSKSIIKDSLWAITGSLLSRFSYISAIFYMTRNVSVEYFGIYALLMSTCVTLSITFGMSLDQTATRFIAEPKTDSDDNKNLTISGLIYSSFFFASLIGLIFILFSTQIATKILESTNDSIKITVVGLHITALILWNFAKSILVGLSRFKQLYFFVALNGLAQSIGLICSIYFRLSHAWLFLLLTVPLFLFTIIILFKIKNEFVLFKANNALRSKPFLNAIRTHTIPNMLSGSIASLALWLMIILLSKSPNGLAETAYYSAGYQWHGPLVFIPLMINSVMAPRYTASMSDNSDSKGPFGLYKTNVIIMSLASLPIVFFLFFDTEIISLSGKNYSGKEEVLILLAAAAYFHAFSKLNNTYFVSQNLSWQAFMVNCIWVCTIISLGFTLIPKSGSTGLSIALLVAYLFSTITGVLLIIKKKRYETD